MPLELRWLAAFGLFVLLPGWLLVGLLLVRRAAGALETGLLTLAAGYALAVLLGLAVHALFRPAAPWQLALGGGALAVGLAALAAWRGAGLPLPALPVAPRLTGPTVLKPAGPALLVLVVAGALRLADLGWSEFQGDEARVALRALAALQGEPGALAAHRKVPGEILLAYLFAGSLGQVVELTARLPFAVAGVGAVLAFYALARALLGPWAALTAGLLLAVNGYFVAFGRILQYDSLAFFLGSAGLLCCWRFARAGCEASDARLAGDGVARDGADAAVAWAVLAALLLAGAALVALGAVFFLAPAALLAWPGLARNRRSWRVLSAWSWPVLPLLLVAALVLAGDEAGGAGSTVWSYLGPRLGGERPYWNAAAFVRSANHYLSTPYLGVVLAGGLLALLLALGRALRPAGRRGLAARLAVGVALAAASWARPEAALAVGALLLLLLVIRAPGQPLATRVGLAWAAGPLFVHLLLVRMPGTHWREAFPGLILLLAALTGPVLVNRRSRPVVAVLLLALVAGAGHYAWVTLVQRWPEYQLAYPTARHPLDWTVQDGRGIGGVFGAVHRHGWKALGVLDADGALAGGFATNESPAIAAWYLRRPQGCAGALRYVFRVQRTPQDRNLSGPVPLPSGLVNRGQVLVGGRTRIAVLVPPGAGTGLPSLDDEAYAERFDRELTSAWRPVGELYRADLGAAAARRACAGAQAAAPTR